MITNKKIKFNKLNYGLALACIYFPLIIFVLDKTQHPENWVYLLSLLLIASAGVTSLIMDLHKRMDALIELLEAGKFLKSSNI